MSGTRRLVIHADDFGLTSGVNAGIAEGITRGAVTSTSIMATADAFDEAVAIAIRDGFDVGVHLTLVEERPRLPPDRVRSLVGPGGRFVRSFRELVIRLIAGRVDASELEAELRAQIERCIDAGLSVTHIDSHQHVHLWPSILPTVMALAKSYDIPVVRCARLRLSTEWRSRGQGATLLRFGQVTVLSALSHRAARALAASGLVTTDHVQGVFTSGRLDAARLRVLLAALRPGTTELVVHPGIGDAETSARYPAWGFDWRAELDGLIEAVEWIATREDIRLCSMRELAHVAGSGARGAA